MWVEVGQGGVRVGQDEMRVGQSEVEGRSMWVDGG